MKNSIVIRAYNAQATIERALQSALNQDFPTQNYEVVVVNDGSKDNTLEIVRNFENNPLVVVIDQENKGAVATANIGCKASRGEYVILLDSDDCFEPHLLRRFSQLFDENESIDFAYCGYYEEFQKKRVLVQPKNMFEAIAGGMMYRRDSLAKEGFFREEVIFAEYDLILRTWQRWKSAYANEPLLTYFRREASISGDAERVREGLKKLQELHPSHIDLIKKIRSYALVS
ncbi:MAG: glycosyltransferase family 2 protein [Candidatus Wildermuthbacteria bacterium]|nr:glycosyltransferase family 2 protein [Candidatus Wildermuthbacteria bacterium]